MIRIGALNRIRRAGLAALMPLTGVAALLGGWLLLLPQPVAAHGVAPTPGPLIDVLLSWSVEWYTVVPLLAAAWLYHQAIARVDRAHPANPVPRWRGWSWYAGLLTIFVALDSPIGTYDTTLLSVHMVQHLLLIMVAAPLLAIGAPITLLLRVSSPATRRRWILPVLHSRFVRVIGHPVVTWVIFAAVLWASHFSPLYNASLDNEAIHVMEHGLYLASALLFWWPVVGADPSPWRMPHPARIAYIVLSMPQTSFLGLAIYSAPDVLYAHYATLIRSWGPTPLADQQLGGGIMWVGADMMLFVALLLALWVWLRAEEAEGRREDVLSDREARRLSRQSSATLSGALDH
jgi:cytochrome c oxidase assembly factor CtaG